jgi:hypothetical protein
MEAVTPRPALLAARAGGLLLSAAIAGILSVRRPRPIHSRGVVLSGELLWTSRTGAPAGIEWIDEPPPAGLETVTVRLSRGIGLPAPLPDVLGLALRAHSDKGLVDINLSSTGRGPVGRYLLAPHAFPERAWYGSLMPYRGSDGPVLIAARPRMAVSADTGELAFDVYFAGLRSKWRRFAQLRLTTTHEDSDALRFDPLRAPHGATTYQWARLLREPSYLRARRG